MVPNYVRLAAYLTGLVGVAYLVNSISGDIYVAAAAFFVARWIKPFSSALV